MDRRADPGMARGAGVLPEPGQGGVSGSGSMAGWPGACGMNRQSVSTGIGARQNGQVTCGRRDGEGGLAMVEAIDESGVEGAEGENGEVDESKVGETAAGVRAGSQGSQTTPRIDAR